MIRKLSTQQFRERLLNIMDKKHHWAWSYFTSGQLTKTQLKIHFQQEYAVYVRDFPVFLARIHGQNPPADVRRMLAENIYEEDTGGLTLGHSHPELFLTMMKGLGHSQKDFERIVLLPASRAYRRYLDRVSISRDWAVGAATLAIFVEGSVNDRREILEPSKPKTPVEIEKVVKNHSLVQHYGLSPDCLDLIRAHQMVEAGHRQDAYTMILTHVVDPKRQQAILMCLQRALHLWLRYRNSVARACGLEKPSKIGR
jgi:pyrroloquinoline quinone (PQQ) biosynthesis protein C